MKARPMGYEEFGRLIIEYAVKKNSFVFSLGLKQTGKDYSDPDIVSGWEISYLIEKKLVGFEHFNRYQEDGEDMPYNNLSHRVNYCKGIVAEKLDQFSLQELKSKMDFYSARLIRVE